MNQRALILGCGGMDGSHLTDILLSHGYEVHGTYRRSSVNNLSRISHVLDRITLHRAELQDGASIERIVREVRPATIYNEADQDHVGFSRDTPQVSIDVTSGAVQRLLETVLRVDKTIRVFQPLSATMFGRTTTIFQDEDTKLSPASPYACAKVAAWYICQHYRREHGLFVACGILFNHESERRGPDYLLQRIIREARLVSEGKKSHIELANINMKVDIGYSPDYMDAAYRMMQSDYATDYVIGTGLGIPIKLYAMWALEHWGLHSDLAGYIKVVEDSRFANEPTLVANTQRIYDHLGWEATTARYNLVKQIINNMKEVNV